MQRSLSLPHVVVAIGLVLIAGWLGLVSGNLLGAVYGLIAATLAAARSIEPATPPAPATVRVEP